MGLLDLFKSSENKRLKEENERLRSTLSPEQQDLESILKRTTELRNEENKLEQKIKKAVDKLDELQQSYSQKKAELIILDDELLMQSFGLYEPLYDFATSDEYKNKLKEIRNLQKEMIKEKTAVSYFDGWVVDGSKAKGKKMTNDNIKQIIRTFNTECEAIIDKVKFNNIEAMKKRLEKSFQDLNKMNTNNRVALSCEFLATKILELNVAHEYQLKKQEEKEEQKRIREELREQAKLQKELLEAKKNITKDIKHFNNALEAIKQQLLTNELNDEDRQLLLQKQTSLEQQLTELNKNLADVDYRQNNQKAGYVYIISNIGAFGENVYKIGMTRRLDPQDRVDELGDASVPFNFDVHAMIFTEDAPALENALHKAFENKKVNMINSRREFFNVTLEEIEQVVKANYDKTVDFKKTADAEQYRETLKMKQSL